MLQTVHPQSSSSGSLGFRPPGLSDDVDWLPAWLQPHVAAIGLDGEEEDKEPQELGGCSFKEVSQSGGSRGHYKDANGVLLKDIRKEGLRLHLSGDDDSSVPGTVSHEKVLLFTLHLSTDGSSSSHYFPTGETSSDGRLKSVEPNHMQSVKDLRRSGETKQSNINSNLDHIKLSSTCNQKLSVGPASQIQCNSQDTSKQFLPKPNRISSDDNEIRDAVELSTAASEALVIYELIKREAPSDALLTTSILELALRVKQTRLQWLNDVLTFSNSNDRISNSDVLSDLDDYDMEDAYEDVGLSLTSSANICTDGTSVSHVEETPISRQHFGEDGTAGSKHESQENNLCDSGAEKQLEMLKIDLANDNADAEKQNLVRNDDNLDWIPSIACGDDPIMYQLCRRNSEDIKSQVEDALRGAKRRRINHRKNLIETSYFSESADIAPDLNSCAVALDRSLKVSQPSIHMDGLCRIESNRPLLSQDIAKNSALSFVDPLCSVIPCSISTRTHDQLSAHSYDHGKHIGDTTLIPEVGSEAQNVHIASSQRDEIVYGEKQDKTSANSLNCYVDQRYVTSLDACSLQSSWQPCNIQNDASHMQAQQVESMMEARSISCKQKISSVNSLQSECSGAVTNGAELHISLQNEDTTPLLLCHGTRHRVQAHRHPISTEKQDLADDSLAKFDPSGILRNPSIQNGKFPDSCTPTRKRVRFDVDDVEYQKKGESSKLTSIFKSRRSSRSRKRKQPSDQQHCWSSQELKEHLTNVVMKDKKKPIFQGLDFLITGFPCKKEKEVERILRRYGGVVLADIPSPPKKVGRNMRSDYVQLPVVICTKKLQTRKFLYGCAVNAFLLQLDWVTDSIEAGSVLPPKKYMMLPNQRNRWGNRIQKPIHQRTVDRIFCKIGIMLHGEHGFCFELTEVIKHGQGHIYKTLQGLVQSLKNKTISTGIIIADNESYATRHLRKCASDQKIPMMIRALDPRMDVKKMSEKL